MCVCSNFHFKFKMYLKQLCEMGRAGQSKKEILPLSYNGLETSVSDNGRHMKKKKKHSSCQVKGEFLIFILLFSSLCHVNHHSPQHLNILFIFYKIVLSITGLARILKIVINACFISRSFNIQLEGTKPVEFFYWAILVGVGTAHLKWRKEWSCSAVATA